MITLASTEPRRCRVTGLPYVRRITFEDPTPASVDAMPAHIPSRVLFDGVPVQGVRVAPVATVALSTTDATKVTLWVGVDDCTPPFLTPGQSHGHAPATIAGHPFMSPLEDYWVADEPPTDPGGDPTVTWVRCTVYVAEVEIR